jgi:hypothetical protein
LGRFEAAGLTSPTINSVTFTLYSATCDDVQALFIPEERDVTFCFDEGRVCSDDTCSELSTASRSLVLHEFAHAWMDVTLDDTVRQQFTDHVGLEVWSDYAVPWDQRAIEHAADTIVWGLMDHEIAMWRIGNPTPDQLTTGFRILTGTDPLPKS